MDSKIKKAGSPLDNIKKWLKPDHPIVFDVDKTEIDLVRDAYYRKLKRTSDTPVEGNSRSINN